MLRDEPVGDSTWPQLTRKLANQSSTIMLPITADITSDLAVVETVTL